MAPKNAREALVNVDVAPQEERAAPAAFPSIPSRRALVKKVATHNLTVSRQLRQTIFGLWHTDSTYS